MFLRRAKSLMQSETPTAIQRLFTNKAKLLLLLFSIMFSLVCVEVALRLFFPPGFFVPSSVGSAYQRHDVLHHVHRPCSSALEKNRNAYDDFCVNIYFNSAGFRSAQEYSVSKPENVTRVMILGDSFVEARQVWEHQMVSNIFGKLLANERDREIEVLAQGVSSWSPVIEWLYFSTEGYRYSPDLLFLLASFNDISDDYRRYYRIARFDKDGIPVAVPSKDPHVKPDDQHSFLQKHSALYALLGSRVERLSENLKKQQIVADYRSREALSVSPLAIFNEELSDEDHELINATFSHIRRLYQFAGEHGTRMVLVLIPFPHQVSIDEWRAGKQLFGIPVDYVEKSTQLQDSFSAFAAKNDIPFLDLLPYLKRSNQRIFFEYDGHFTPAGHRVVAEALHSFTMHEGLLR
ncbi:SGNH/GDSL hydrolase family protein [Planctomycetota bacterium]